MEDTFSLMFTKFDWQPSPFLLAAFSKALKADGGPFPGHRFGILICPLSVSIMNHSGGPNSFTINGAGFLAKT